MSITAGSGTTIATDEVGGAQWQRVKIGTGEDGSATDVSTANPMPTGGNKAHGAADAGNPVKVGARARVAALPTAVEQDQRTDNISDKFGRQLATVSPLDVRVSGTLNLTNTESKEVIAGVASTAIVVTAISVTNASATVGTKVEIFDEATAKWKAYAAAVGGGFVISDPNGLWVGTKEKPVKAKCVTTGSDTDVSISGYRVPA